MYALLCLKKKGRSRKSSNKNSQGGGVIQIDGAKKQLMADQIRQKMQGKLTMPPPSIMGRLERHRGRGRPPRNSVVSNMDHSNEVRQAVVLNYLQRNHGWQTLVQIFLTVHLNIYLYHV